jgi:hypothetical protein
MTRLIWVIVFAVLVGAMLLFFARTMQSGSRVSERLAEVASARQALTGMFPQDRIRIQQSQPRPGIRNLVVTIQPARTDSTSVQAVVAAAESVVRSKVSPAGFDSLVVAIFDRVERSVPLR